jgi:hypothetical protein
MVLLVVPANADPDKAHATQMAAAAPTDYSTVDNLLMVSAREREKSPSTRSAVRPSNGCIALHPV